VTAFREGNVVGKLIGARIGGPDVISSNRRKTITPREVDARKATIGRVIRDIDIQKPKLRNGRGPFNGEIRSKQGVGEPKANFIQQRRRDGIVVRNQKTSVMFGINVIG
jgi:hypothetical protein